MFQLPINKLINSNYLQFNALIWDISGTTKKVTDKIDRVDDNVFPYLDIEFFWNGNDLNAQIYINPTQHLSHPG